METTRKQPQKITYLCDLVLLLHFPERKKWFGVQALHSSGYSGKMHYSLPITIYYLVYNWHDLLKRHIVSILHIINHRAKVAEAKTEPNK